MSARVMPGRRGRPPRRGRGYLLTGLLLGLGVGLFIAWVVAPVRYTDTAPDRLRVDFKDAYRALIALAYMGNPDLARARARLALLADPNPAQALAVQAQARAADPRERAALQRLAAALVGQPLPPAAPTATAIPQPGPTTNLGAASSPAPSPRPTATVVAVQPPTPTPTTRPTPGVTPSPTPLPFFRVFRRETVCDPAHPGLVRVEVYDAQAEPVPGVALLVLGPEGEQVIYTGLQPDRGLGYADFVMAPGATYRLRVRSGSETVDGLSAVRCRGEDGADYPGGWEIIFSAGP